jgi:Zn-dependent M28 family amino/carboxypeptidase
MMPRSIVALLLLGSASLASSAPVATQTEAAERVRADVAFLSDDLLEGRDTGSRGHEIAARFVASRFAALGLKPAGDNGSYFQRITFQRSEAYGKPGTVTISGPAGEQQWTHATEVLVGLNPLELNYDVAAPLVFVGYGIENDRLGIDDYRGLDVKGKIVVVLDGFPKGMPSEEGAHLTKTKADAAQRHGAVGMVEIDTALSAKTHPWKRVLPFSHKPKFTWIGPDGKPFVDAPGIRASAALNGPAAEAAFAGAPRSLAAIRAEADRIGSRPKGFPLKTRMRITENARAERVTSPNVVAMIPGSDPKLARQYVILSAHLDHIGISAPQPGDTPQTDRINNGALDNAAGTATMLEVAREAALAPNKPRRSILFLASTGEEKGLLGADYYAQHPTVPISSIVGDVDLDMPLLLYHFTDVIAFGANHSTLGPLTAAAVAPMGIKLSPDPMPQEGIFTRSDHYMFVRQGVPAVFLATGYANGGAEQWDKFLSGNYHHPGDDMNQPIDWESGARFAEANYRIMRAMADADSPPSWYRGDFFGDTFAPGRPRAVR